MKKALALILSMIMIIALCACGGNKAEETKAAAKAETKAEAKAEAKEEASRITERARNEAELEKQKATDDVKREMVVLASLMAGKVVKASIDTTVQDSLVEDTLKEIGDSTWLS